MDCYKEPTLDETIDDPIIRALMVADGVDPQRLVRTFEDLADKLGRRTQADAFVPLALNHLFLSERLPIS